MSDVNDKVVTKHNPRRIRRKKRVEAMGKGIVPRLFLNDSAVASSPLSSGHFLVNLDRLRKAAVVHSMDFRHMSLPVVFPGECFTTGPGIVAT